MAEFGQNFEFEDVLTGAKLSCNYPGMRALQVDIASEPLQANTIFFPGCSFINYGLPLVSAVQDLLKSEGIADGTSLLCCGKILTYEPDGKAKRSTYENELRDHLLDSGVKRIITACPNCTKALRELLAAEEKSASIEVIPLPKQLVEMGYKANPDVVRQMITNEYEQHSEEYAVCIKDIMSEDLRVSFHDSCPDRDWGEFADGGRSIVGEELVNEMAHIRKKSLCCGSLVRAAGKFDAAVKQSETRGREAEEAKTHAIVTPCVSCTYLLSKQQKHVPVFHYLELLYNWRINWHEVEDYMKLRFLFEECYGLYDKDGHPVDSGRPFVGLESN